MSRSPQGIITPLILFTIALIVYQLTRANSLVTIDAGELAAVQLLPGVAHPTGYPLFTMLGYMWSKIPIGLTPIAQLNMLAGLYTALSIPFFFQALLNIISGGRRPNFIERCSALGGVGIIMFSSTFWASSTSTEIYSLHILILSWIMWLMSRIINSDAHARKQWLLVAFVLALGFSNHLTTVMTLLGLAYLFIRRDGIAQPRTFVMGSFVFVLTVCCLYSYVFLMAKSGPLMNWGDADTLSRLWAHVSGEQYRIYTFDSIGVAVSNLRYFLASIPEEFTWAGLILGLIGGWRSWTENREVLLFTAICLVTCVGLAINYNIPDLSTYFLLGYISIAVFIAFGFRYLSSLIHGGYKNAVIVSATCLIPIYMLGTGFTDIDQSRNYAIEDYNAFGLKSVEASAILLTSDFETDISPAFYNQHIKQLRTDVKVIDFLSFISQDWYGDYLKRIAPELIPSIESELRTHETTLRSNDLSDERRQRAQKTFRDLIHKMIAENINEYPIYISHGVYRDYLQPSGHIPLPFDHWIVPQAAYYRLHLDDVYRPFEYPETPLVRYGEFDDSYTLETQQYGEPHIETYRNPKHHIGEIRFAQALMLDHRIQYELRHEKYDEAKNIAEVISKNFPAYQLDARVLQAMETN